MSLSESEINHLKTLCKDEFHNCQRKGYASIRLKISESCLRRERVFIGRLARNTCILEKSTECNIKHGGKYSYHRCQLYILMVHMEILKQI